MKINEVIITEDDVTALNPFWRTRIFKHRKEDVKQLQQALIALGFDVGPAGADGILGRDTSNAIQNFQKTYGLAVDGDPGPNTTRTLNSLIKGNIEVKPAEKYFAKDVEFKRTTKRKPQQISVKTDISGNLGKMLDFIASYESVGGRYDSVYPGKTKPEILDMTLDELIADMRTRGRKTGSSASGRYQIIRETLEVLIDKMNLDPKQVTFNEDTQDSMCAKLLEGRGYFEWANGVMSDDEFLHELSKEWASLPDPKRGGKSHYGGDGKNKALVSLRNTNKFLASLKDIPKKPKTNFAGIGVRPAKDLPKTTTI